MNSFRMTHGTWLRPALAASLFLVSGSSFATGLGQSPKEPSIQSVTPAEIQAAALTVQNQNGVDYVSGGIGVAERAWLAKHAKEYDVRLTFAQEPGGSYLSGVNVSITSKTTGKVVLSTDTDGPMLFTNLPAGHYELKATLDGHTVDRTLAVSKFSGRKWVIGFRQS